jgi:ABC-type transporter Mla maintaining outer membrane lipid asymmetry ATPase subunit MlaF
MGNFSTAIAIGIILLTLSFFINLLILRLEKSHCFMTTQFKLHNIVKRYASRTVIDIDQLDLQEGRIYTIMGPNGSGKSTLLRIMSLLLVNDAGEIEVMGEK